MIMKNMPSIDMMKLKETYDIHLCKAKLQPDARR